MTVAITLTIRTAATPFIGEHAARDLANNLGGCFLEDLTEAAITKAIARRTRMGQCSCDAAACARAIVAALEPWLEPIKEI